MAEAKITKRSEDYSRWYTDVIAAAELADYAPVKGCMIIRPNGYAIWEKMQQALDGMFKETGHQNAYFPLFIPESFLQKEAEHVEGFAPEVAIVTHAGGSKLEEPLVIRPTSETIIWNSYKNWIQSYRDLPLLINQWCDVVRWEMRTRLFLRTSEFLWQEGHTVHASSDEAIAETLTMLDVYERLAVDHLAIPVVKGEKTPNERFPGAINTYSVEAMMQDGKALQAGTSHFLGQNFAKAFDVQFQTEKGNREYAYATSWGVSTRLIGGLIMTHSDDNGLVVPPRLASTHVVICPLGKNDAERAASIAAAEKLAAELRGLPREDFFGYEPIAVKVDMTFDKMPGFRFAEYELRGVPVRVEIGPKDIEKSACVLARRDKPGKEGKQFGIPLAAAAAAIRKLLGEIQTNLFETAKKFRDERTRPVNSYEEFKTEIEKPGFLLAHWDGTRETEDKIQEETKATIRCIPFDRPKEEGKCMVTGKPSAGRVVFARAY